MSDGISSLITYFVIGVMLWMANAAVVHKHYRLAWSVLVHLVLFSFIAQTGLAFLRVTGLTWQASLALFIALACGLVAVALLHSEKMVHRLAQTGRFRAAFSACNPLHLTGLVLAFLATGATFLSYAVSGGLAGIAETIETSSMSPYALGFALIINGLGLCGLAFVGVGLGWRRTMKQAVHRLGLVRPRSQPVMMGIAVGVVAFLALIPASLVLSVISNPQSLAEQQIAARAVFAQYQDYLFLGALLALSSGLGEEVVFRGALQPVLGLWATTLCFALIHVQYALTPGWFIIIGIGLAFGWLRDRHGTLAAIIAHVVYNLLPFVLVALAGTGAVN